MKNRSTRLAENSVDLTSKSIESMIFRSTRFGRISIDFHDRLDQPRGIANKPINQTVGFGLQAHQRRGLDGAEPRFSQRRPSQIIPSWQISNEASNIEVNLKS